MSAAGLGLGFSRRGIQGRGFRRRSLSGSHRKYAPHVSRLPLPSLVRVGSPGAPAGVCSGFLTPAPGAEARPSSESPVPFLTLWWALEIESLPSLNFNFDPFIAFFKRLLR